MFESSVHVLNSKDMDLIHESAQAILSDVGARVDHPRMRELLADFGCVVDEKVVKFPETVIEDVVSKMRNPHNLIDGYVGTLPLRRDRFPKEARIIPVATGQATLAHDLNTDEIRPATRQDLAESCRVVAALPGSVIGHPVFLPQDAPEMIRDLLAMKTVAENFPYSDFVEVYSPEVIPYFLEMGRVICGSEEALKEAPPFCSWAFATSPLQFGRHGFDILFKFLDYGLRKGFGVGGVMPILGASTPLTMAGYLTMQTAEVLACNIMNWVLLGRVSGYGAGPTILDMKLATPSQSAPEAVLLFLACMDLQRYYGETSPMFPYALSADSKFPDIQAGIDKTFSATVAVLAGCRVLSAGMGVLSLGGVASLAQLVIDYELCQYLEHLVKGFVVDEPHIGLEMIKRVGIGGNFLGEEHTLKYMRETLFFPKVFDRQMVSSWMENRKGMLERAKARVHEILHSRVPQEYLAPEQVIELDKIIQHASERLAG